MADHKFKEVANQVNNSINKVNMDSLSLLHKVFLLVDVEGETEVSCS